MVDILGKVVVPRKPNMKYLPISSTHLWRMSKSSYSVPHNHGSGKWLYLKGNYYWRDPFLTSMVMGGSVCFLPNGRVMVVASTEITTRVSARTIQMTP